MPAYNYGHFIEQAVRSVFAQTHRPLELVVVDDGSTDDTWTKLERLKLESPIPMKIVMGQHRGVAAAMNLALRHATGEWISVLHADDYSRPDRVEKQMAVTRPGVILVHSEYVCVDPAGAATGYDSSVDLPPVSGEALRDLLLFRGDVRSMTVMFRRSGWEDMGGYDETLPVEDWQSILRLSKRGLIAHVPEPLVYRRVHGQNISITAHSKKRTLSFKEAAVDVLREVCPPDLDVEKIAALHVSVVIRHALAIGAWAKAADGIRQFADAFPSELPRLLSAVPQGVLSFVWMTQVKDRLPTPALEALLRMKASAIRARSRLVRR